MTATYKRHANIPIFIPHEGCPNDCVFCNQRKITGTCLSADRDISTEIDAALETIDTASTYTEIAFFGGSFTGIDRGIMERLLKSAYGYIQQGKVSTIRLSTRPDYINDEILDVLSHYGVQHIELGIQSASDAVLLASRRGHTFADTVRACDKIIRRGFVLGGQMMIGLPGATAEDEVFTAGEICRLGAKEARIYPTVVFRETELCRMAQCGNYFPLEQEDAVERSAACLKVFIKNGVKVLRIGLQSGENLTDPNEVYGGANHPAMGELCESRVYLDIIKKSLSAHVPFTQNYKNLEISVPYGEVSKAAGHKKANKAAISAYLLTNGAGRVNIKITEQQLEKYTVTTRFYN